jgi:hypothetical protein
MDLFCLINLIAMNFKYEEINLKIYYLVPMIRFDFELSIFNFTLGLAVVIPFFQFSYSNPSELIIYLESTINFFLNLKELSIIENILENQGINRTFIQMV